MKLIITILSALLFVSCRTTSEAYNKQEEIKREALERLTLQQHTASSVLDSILSRYKATIKKTERIYSAPDSTGSQAVISETEYKVDLEGEKKTITTQKNDQNLNLTNNKAENETDQINESRDKEIDSRLFKPPSWFIVTILIILVIGIFFYCRKRFVHI